LVSDTFNLCFDRANESTEVVDSPLLQLEALVNDVGNQVHVNLVDQMLLSQLLLHLLGQLVQVAWHLLVAQDLPQNILDSCQNSAELRFTHRICINVFEEGDHEALGDLQISC